MESHRLRPGAETPERPRRRARAERAPLDADWLTAEAMRYVARWEASARGVRDALERRLARRCERTGEDGDALYPEIPGIVERLVARGYVDDRRFADQLFDRLRRQGRSRAQIRSQLFAKGVDAALVDEIERARTTSEGRSLGDAELEAAWRTARKRRLGPYCPDPAARAERRQRHLGVLARQGFSREIAHQVVDAEHPPEGGNER